MALTILKRSRLAAIILIALTIPAVGHFSLPVHAGPATIVGVWYPNGASENVNLPVGTTFSLTVNVTNAPSFVGYRMVFSYNTLLLDTLSATTEGTWACPTGNTICETETVDINDPLGTVDVDRSYVDAHDAGNGTMIFINLQVTGVGATLLGLEVLGFVDTNFGTIPATVRDGRFNNSGLTPPIAEFTFRSLNSTHQAEGRIVQGDIVEFNASLSYDPDGGNITKYRWNFRDGSADATVDSTNPVVTHIFRTRFSSGTGEAPLYGNFTVFLVVFDDDIIDTSTGETQRSEPTEHNVYLEELRLHDVAVIGVSVPTQALLGSVVKIQVQVANQGSFNETFPVGFYQDAVRVGNPVTLTLVSRETESLTFDWNTTGLDPTVYQITVRAATVVNETDIADNQQIVFVRLFVPSESSLPLFVGGGLGGIVAVVVAYSLLRRRKPRIYS